MMRIAVAIPTFIRDLQTGNLRRCLDSIEAQTRKPDMVVLSASSCTLHQLIEAIPSPYSFPLRVQLTDRKQSAAANRNVAISLLCDDLADTDIVSFFDSDDVMSPLRLEHIEHAFQDASCSYVLHNFIQLRSPPSSHPECPRGDFNVVTNAFKPDGRPYCSVFVDPALGISGTQFGPGHGSVRAEVLNHHRYKETTGSILWEDSIFIRDLAYAGYSGSYIHMPLAVYHNYRL